MKIKDLQESSLSRVYHSTLHHDYGIISANRYGPDCGKGEPYTYRQNVQRTKSLLHKLRLARYSVTSIRGSYIENYGSDEEHEVGENSFLVVDIQNIGTLRETLLRLGEEFEQDGVIIGSASGPAILVGTNHCPLAYPGYMVEISLGDAIFGKTGEFMSRVNGRPFVFAESVDLIEYGTAKFPTELRGHAILSKKEWNNL